jgi:16S rRNA (adenine1518-N6/adenine1519-N6)-dimethyltransferase
MCIPPLQRFRTASGEILNAGRTIRLRSQSQRKPKLGQHFLVSASAPARIVAALGPLAGRTVVEIGPGTGALTRLLATRAESLVAIEYDRELAARMESEFSGRPGVRVLAQDVLQVDFASLAGDSGRKLLVTGNLPYYITSDILLHLFAAHEGIETAVLMVQREVAERVAASPGTRDYGLLSATTRLYAQAEALFTLPPEDFSPPPEVYSTVLRLTMSPRLADLHVPPAPFQAFLRRCFAQKRKTLANNLRAAGVGSSETQAALAACGIGAGARAESVDLPAMACLFRHLRAQTSGSPDFRSGGAQAIDWDREP